MFLRLIILTVITLIFSSSSCKKPLGAKHVHSFWIENKSGLDISYQLGLVYPDTTIPNEESNLLRLEPGSKRPHDYETEIEEFIEQLPGDTLSVFFFDDDTLGRYSFEEIQNNYSILIRKDVSIEDLRRNQFTVSFP